MDSWKRDTIIDNLVDLIVQNNHDKIAGYEMCLSQIVLEDDFHELTEIKNEAYQKSIEILLMDKKSLHEELIKYRPMPPEDDIPF